MNERLTIDGLRFEVRRSPRRKTLEIIVDRGGELRMAAPEDCDQEVMRTFAREKRFWILTKLAEKESLRQPIGHKEFVNGEGFPYLGRSHRLLLVPAQERPLALASGRWRLVRAEAPNGRQHFIDWYTEHAADWIGPRLDRWAPRVAADPKEIAVRDLGFRWGSCSKDGTLNFNWATILLPPGIVDYVIVHELTHLKERAHTPEFWLQVERVMPDYERRKKWLAEHGGAAVVL